MSYEVKIENFEGPLDLLLHLIKKNEMDIYDIPICEITDQYLATIDAMKSFNLDVAGEFLLMAATLIHIKSRMLLPQAEEDEDEEDVDPRAELVRRLLEYQKYKEASETLNSLSLLDRDVFARKFHPPELDMPEDEEFEAIGLYDLVEAFRNLLKDVPEESFHEVVVEELSVTSRINEILSLLSGKASITFSELFSSNPNRQEMVVTFLAMLELVKLRLVRFMQNVRCGTIWLFPAVSEEELSLQEIKDESLGYG